MKLSEEAFTEFKSSLLPNEKYNEAIIRLCRVGKVGNEVGQVGNEGVKTVGKVGTGVGMVGRSDSYGEMVPPGTDSKDPNASDDNIGLEETLSKFGLNKEDVGSIIRGIKTLFGFRSRREPKDKRWPDVLTPAVLKNVVWGIVAVVLGLEIIRYVVPWLLEVSF